MIESFTQNYELFTDAEIHSRVSDWWRLKKNNKLPKTGIRLSATDHQKQ